MKKIDWKTLILTCAACLLPMVLGIALYDKLPASVAIHFNIYGEADGFFPRAAFVFGMPSLMLLLQAICCAASDCTEQHKEANRKAMRVFKWFIPVLCCVLYCVTLCIALGYDIDIRRVVMLILGLVFIVTGNYLPKTRETRNKWGFGFGMKGFGKARSEAQQRKLNRYTGYCMIAGGLLCILSIAFSPIVSIIALGALLLVFFALSILIKK